MAILGRTLQQLRNRLSYAQWRWKIKRKVRQYGPPILVYQMGKVGSESITASIKNSVPNVCVHTHTFGDTPLAREILFTHALQNQPLSVISLVREPIGRNISAFLQNFERETGVAYDDSDLSIDALISTFLYKYPHDIPLRWFQRNIGQWLNIDVYSHPFPDDGIQFIEHGNTRLLVMRLTVPDEQKEDAIAELLGLDTFTITRSNVGAEKPYAEAYSAFRDAFSAPEWMIRRLYDSTYFNHFYGDEEKARLIQKWT